MLAVKEYLKEILGTDLYLERIRSEYMDGMPFYIRETFLLHYARLFNHDLILAELKTGEAFSTTRTGEQFQFIKSIFNRKVVLLANNLTAIDRKRLIQKDINFIVPGKQLFLPQLLIDLREVRSKKKAREGKLLPSAQYLLLYNILHGHDKKKITDYSFKELAKKLNYSQMGITKAVDNLKYHELCKTEGTKEKHIRFNYAINELWQVALPVLVTPVIKKVYVDEIPAKLYLYHSNLSALPEYSDMAESLQEYRAIEKNIFYSLQKNNKWVNPNESEGRYCLEVWKYNPAQLTAGITEERNVDPLSLYLSLKDSHEERTEMALEQIIDKYIW